MVFPEVDLLFQFQLISVQLSIEAVVLLEYTCQRSYPSVDRTPMCNAFPGIDFRHYIFEMLLAVRLDRNTLAVVSSAKPSSLLNLTFNKSQSITSPAVSNVSTLRRSFSR
jgi:hypothetical protein